MKTYIAILRGINVGGHKKIKMDLLKKMCDGLGFADIRTYIQSGNLIFSAKGNSHNLQKMISEQIQKEFGFEVPVIVKDMNDVRSILENNPFDKEDESKLHVTFFSEKAFKPDLKKLEGNYSVDKFILKDDTVYLFCPSGYGNTKLTNNFFENKLKVTATTRNWKTVNELYKIALESGKE